MTKLEVKEGHPGMGAPPNLARIEELFMAMHNFQKMYFVSLNETTHVKWSFQYLEHSKHLINVNCYYTGLVYTMSQLL